MLTRSTSAHSELVGAPRTILVRCGWRAGLIGLATLVLLAAAPGCSSSGAGNVEDRATDSPRVNTTERDATAPASPLFPEHYVLATESARQNPLRVAPDELDRDLTVEDWPLASLPPDWSDGTDSLDRGAGTVDDRETQLNALIRAFTGPAAWDRAGTSIELTRDGLRVRQCKAVHDRIALLFDAIVREDHVPVIGIATRLVAVNPGAMSAFHSLTVLPDGSRDTVHAVLADQDAVAFLEQLSIADPEAPASAPALSVMAGQRATVGTMTERAYVVGFDRVKAGGDVADDAGDPVIGTDVRGFVLGVRALPINDSREFVLTFEFEMAPRVPFLAYPLNGGRLTAQAPRGGRIRAAGSATIPAGHTLVVVAPDTVQHDGEARLLLMFLSPRDVSPHE